MTTFRKHGFAATPGFSLIELLVVVALIAFLSVGIGLALGSGNEGTRMRASEASLSGYLQFLRSKAILEGQPARLLIAADAADADRYLRTLGGVVRDGTNSNRWVAVDDGLRLADGVYFWEDQSTVGLSQMLLAYPQRSSVEAGAGDSWLYLEIGSTGELSLEAGSLTLFSDRPQPGDLPMGDDDSFFGGFWLSRLGVIVFPQDKTDLIR